MTRSAVSPVTTRLIEARFKGSVGRFSLDISFAAPARGITAVFGPSGSGKTTILRCIAGLTRMTGYLNVAGAIWQDETRFSAPHRRPIGYVFQEPRLFPHLSVQGNLDYGLRRVPTPSRDVEPARMIEFMGIGGLLDRSPATLSGGESQRVAIARALLSHPRLLLMDEPLSAVDAASKQEILACLEALALESEIPILYVSHDMAEVDRLADHLVLLGRDGRVQAEGALTDLLTDLSLPLARLPDAASMISARVDSYDEAYDLTTCSIGSMPFFVPGRLGPVGTQRRVRVRASDVSLITGIPQMSSVLNILPARVLSAQPGNANQMLVLLGLGHDADEARLVSSITAKSWDRLALQVGDAVFAQVKGMAVVDRR